MLRTAPDMKVRLSAALRQKIESTARDNNRTMNAEIVARLEQSFRDGGHTASPFPSPDQEKRLAAIERTILAIIGDPRLETLEERIGALEMGRKKQSPEDSL